MIIVGACVADGGEKFRALTEASLQGLLEPDDVCVTHSGANGISAAYNAILEQARSRPDCELVVLLHDDVEVLDRNFRAKLLAAAARPGAGVLGVIGGRGLRSLKWWQARATAGSVFETREFIDVGPRDSEVDAVDGLFLALAPAVFRSLTFDASAFPRFHGYDVDLCLQARAGGLTNFVVPVELIHRTKGGYGDESAFDAAQAALAAKWPQYVTPDPVMEPKPVVTPTPAPATSPPPPPTAADRARAEARRIARGLVRRARKVRRRAAVALGMPSAPPARSGGKVAPAKPKPTPNAEPAPVAAPTIPNTPAAVVSPATPSAPAAAPILPVPDSLTCPVCTETFTPDPHLLADRPVLACPNCGVGVTWPPPSRDVETDLLWTEMYGGVRLKARDTWFREAQSRIDWIKLFAPEGLVLEVGCGTGEFVTTARDNGYEAYGVEPSEWAAEQARDIGGDVVAGFTEDWSASHRDIQPDIVAIWHVLEHVPDPAAFLTEMRALLRPDGRLFIEVPNYASTDAQILGAKWSGLQREDHFHQFGPKNLRLLLERQGFEVEVLHEISARIYLSPKEWNNAKNAALLERRPWPSHNYLRVSAIARR